MNDSLRDLYSEAIRDHSRAPRCTTPPSSVDGRAIADNPLCGDRVEVLVQIRNDTIEALGHTTRGCALCVAAASMMGETVTGLSIRQARTLASELEALLQTGTSQPALGASNAFAAAARFPMRRKCVLLPWQTMVAALSAPEQ